MIVQIGVSHAHKEIKCFRNFSSSCDSRGATGLLFKLSFKGNVSIPSSPTNSHPIHEPGGNGERVSGTKEEHCTSSPI